MAKLTKINAKVDVGDPTKSKNINDTISKINAGVADYNASTQTPAGIGLTPAAPAVGEGKGYYTINDSQGKVWHSTEASADANAEMEANQIKQNALSNQGVTSNDRSAATARFQAEVDALNGVYAEQKRNAVLAGENRLGSNAAVQARRGLLGSDFGAAATAGIEAANKDERDAIDSQHALALSAVYTKVDKAATDAAAARVASATMGADAKIAEIKGRAEKTTKAVTDAAKAYLFSNKGDLSKLTDQNLTDWAKALKTTPENVASIVKDAKIAYDKEQQAANPSFELSQGQSKYVYDSKTGEYKVVASVAPKPTAGTGGASGVSGITDSSDKFYAQLAMSGVNVNTLIPSLGMGTAAVAAKTRLLNSIADNATTLGIDGSTFGAMITDSKAKQKAYDALQKNGAQTAVNENNANKNFQQLIALADKVDAKIASTGAPILDKWIRSGTLATTGDPDINNFLALLTTSLTEYSKVVSGANTGAAVTEGANAQAQELLSSGLSAKTIRSFAEQAKIEMKNRTGSYNEALNNLFGSIKNISDSSGTGIGIDTGDSGILTAPDGSGQVNISELTPAQIEEAKNAGWK